MTRAPLTRQLVRPLQTGFVLALAGALASVVLPTSSALAATPPAPPTSATGTVGDRLLDLAWSGGAGTGAIVRDVTGQSSPYSTGSGRDVAVASATTARDTGFTNTQTATYAIWTTEADGTPSDTPLVTDVAQAPLVSTSLTLTPSAASVPWGTPVTFAGVLTRAGAAPVAGVPVELYGRVGGTTDVRLLRRITTDGGGVASTVIGMSRSTEYYYRFTGDAFSAPSDSPRAVVRVLPRVSIALNPPTIVRREVSVLSGRVVPTLEAAPVAIQRLVGGAWRTIANVQTVSGGYSLRVAPDLGIYRYRAILIERPSYLQAVSRAVELRVEARDLVAGNVGDDVVALKRQLAALHYESGALNATFGYDLTHAVMTFQKVERLPITGRWTKAERTRAGRPTVWKVRYPGSGLAVEIDITRQVLVLSTKGVVTKIIDVSTGTEKPYTYKGESDVAHTPRGRFSIFYKIDGIRVSKLGELYRPSYFYKGWAIHGSGSVPKYPASHGCVRITNPNADRLFPILVKGTVVNLYDE